MALLKAQLVVRLGHHRSHGHWDLPAVQRTSSIHQQRGVGNTPEHLWQHRWRCSAVVGIHQVMSGECGGPFHRRHWPCSPVRREWPPPSYHALSGRERTEVLLENRHHVRHCSPVTAAAAAQGVVVVCCPAACATAPRHTTAAVVRATTPGSGVATPCFAALFCRTPSRHIMMK